MVDPEIIIIPLVFSISGIVLITRMAFRHREKMATLQRPAEGNASIDARLARVEQGIEAIAIEMERVGEGQRFLTNILAQRTASSLPAGEVARSGNPAERR